MKRLLMLACLFLLATGGARAEGIGLGVGLAGGMEFPIAQDDEAQGSVYGLRGLVRLIPAVVLQPNISFANYGDPEFEEFTSDLDGSNVTSYGIDAVLGGAFGATGLWPYGLIGAGFFNTSRDQTEEDATDFGWTAGFGVEIGMSVNFGVDVRGKVVVVSPEGGGTKKSASVTGGLNFYFGK